MHISTKSMGIKRQTKWKRRDGTWLPTAWEGTNSSLPSYRYPRDSNEINHSERKKKENH